MFLRKVYITRVRGNNDKKACCADHCSQKMKITFLIARKVPGVVTAHRTTTVITIAYILGLYRDNGKDNGNYHDGVTWGLGVWGLGYPNP